MYAIARPIHRATEVIVVGAHPCDNAVHLVNREIRTRDERCDLFPTNLGGQ